MLLFFIVFIAQENGDRTSFGCWQLGSNSETASMFSSILLNTCVELYFCVEAVFTRYCTCIISWLIAHWANFSMECYQESCILAKHAAPIKRSWA